MRYLVTGGTGFLGSHTAAELAAAGHDVLLTDNLSNSTAAVADAVARVAGRPVELAILDVRDRVALAEAFARFRPDAVLHFAALKSVAESTAQPLAYYDNNVTGLLVLLECMRTFDVRDLVFSSSATVYGAAQPSPVAENAAIAPVNPYARSKAVCENILFDLEEAWPEFRAAVLRYFNPVGAHPSGLLGETPSGVPNNLMPYVCQVAAGERDVLRVFGDDYPTRDGTGVRDYVHVVDLAVAHVRALQVLRGRAQGFAVNLGTGRGHSVLEVVHAFVAATGAPVPHVIAPRRPGDVAECFADPTLAMSVLGWRAERDMHAMCADAWRWEVARTRAPPGGGDHLGGGSRG